MIKKFMLSEIRQNASALFEWVRAGKSAMLTRSITDLHKEACAGIMPADKASFTRRSTLWDGTEEELADSLPELVKFVETHKACVPITVRSARGMVSMALLPPDQVRDFSPSYNKRYQLQG